MPAKKNTTSRTTPAKRTAAPRKAAAPTKATAPVKTTRPRKAAAAPVQAAVEAVAAETPADQFKLFLHDLKGLADRYLAAAGDDDDTAPFTPDEPLDEPVEADDEGTDEPQSREDRDTELQGWTVRQIQNALIALGYDAADVKSEKDKDTLIENLLSEEFDEDKDADEDDEEADVEDVEDEAEEEQEEEEDDEDAEYDRADLMKLSLAELKKVGVNEFELDASELKGKDKDTIADLIIAAQNGEGDEEYEDEDEEQEEEAGEEDEYYTPDDLKPLPIKEVRAIADEGGIRYTAAQASNKAALIKLICA